MKTLCIFVRKHTRSAIPKFIATLFDCYSSSLKHSSISLFCDCMKFSLYILSTIEQKQIAFAVVEDYNRFIKIRVDNDANADVLNNHIN